MFQCPSTCKRRCTGFISLPTRPNPISSTCTSTLPTKGGQGFVHPVHGFRSTNYTFIDPIAETALGVGLGEVRRARFAPGRSGDTPHRLRIRWCTRAGQRRTGDSVPGRSASGAPTAATVWVETSAQSPRLPGWEGVCRESQGLGVSAPQFPSRASAPPNQRPQRTGSQFKLRRRQLAGIGAEAASAAAAAAATATAYPPWNIASWGPARTEPPSW